MPRRAACPSNRGAAWARRLFFSGYRRLGSETRLFHGRSWFPSLQPFARPALVNPKLQDYFVWTITARNSELVIALLRSASESIPSISYDSIDSRLGRRK